MDEKVVFPETELPRSKQGPGQKRETQELEIGIKDKDFLYGTRKSRNWRPITRTFLPYERRWGLVVF